MDHTLSGKALPSEELVLKIKLIALHRSMPSRCLQPSCRDQASCHEIVAKNKNKTVFHYILHSMNATVMVNLINLINLTGTQIFD